MRPKPSLIPVWIFMALAFVLSWALWIPAIFLHQNVSQFPTALLFTLGAFGPSAAGVLMTLFFYSPDERRSFWRRVFDVKRIDAGQYLFIFLIFPVLTLLALLIHLYSGGSLDRMTTLSKIFSEPLSLVSLLLTTLLIPPVAEELGWRGFALDYLQKRWTPLASSFTLGIIWAAWRLPMWLINGTDASGWRPVSLGFWLFIVDLLPLSILMTWMYNRTRRSILSAILIHFSFNLSAALFTGIPQEAQLLMSLLLILLATVAVIFYTPRVPIQQAGTNTLAEPSTQQVR